MSLSLKPYAEYKESGVQWLGEVPEHWEVSPFRALASARKGRQPRSLSGPEDEADGGIPYLSMGFLRSPTSSPFEFAKPQADLVIAQPDDTILLWDGANAGEFLRAKAGVVSSTSAHIAPRSADRQFFFYACKLSEPTLRAFTVGMGIPHVDGDVLKSIRLPVPPLPEQSAIVRFLDHVDRRIRRYIRAKQRLIKLLEEQKQAIIHRVVARGLDPNVRLKPSGVEWLGEVPEHWEVRPAKYFYREVDDRSDTGSEELLSVSHITGVTPRSQKNITMFMASSYVGHKVCKPGDLVINTMWAWMAALGVARQTGIVSPSYGVYRPLRPTALLGQYADLLLRTKPYVSEYVCRSTGIRSSRLRLYPEQFLRVRILCPPVNEQRTIVEHLWVETGETEQAIAGAQREIELLREYHTRLIADAVTGKLDVRGVELPSLDEGEAEEDLGAVEDAEMEEMTDSDEATDGEEQ